MQFLDFHDFPKSRIEFKQTNLLFPYSDLGIYHFNVFQDSLVEFIEFQDFHDSLMEFMNFMMFLIIV